jgi:hypothetical protein
VIHSFTAAFCHPSRGAHSGPHLVFENHCSANRVNHRPTNRPRERSAVAVAGNAGERAAVCRVASSASVRSSTVGTSKLSDASRPGG